MAKRKIRKGELIAEENIIFKRPANGIEPKQAELIIGKRVLEDLEEDQPILYSSIEW